METPREVARGVLCVLIADVPYQIRAQRLEDRMLPLLPVAAAPYIHTHHQACL